MEPNRTYLLGQNGMPGEYIVSHPSIARSPPQPRLRLQNESETMQRRDSTDSLDSIAHMKEEAQTIQPPRSRLRSAFSKVARQLSGPKKPEVDVGVGQVVEEDKRSGQRPFEVERDGGRKSIDAEKERIQVARNSGKMSRGVSHLSGERRDAREADENVKLGK